MPRWIVVEDTQIIDRKPSRIVDIINANQIGQVHARGIADGSLPRVSFISKSGTLMTEVELKSWDEFEKLLSWLSKDDALIVENGEVNGDGRPEA